MLTLKTIMAVQALERSYGRYEGACFGVTDPSRLRPPTSPSPLSIPPKEVKGLTRTIVMIERDGNMVPDKTLEQDKQKGPIGSIPAIRAKKKRKPRK
jgi:hypothetical protein